MSIHCLKYNGKYFISSIHPNQVRLPSDRMFKINNALAIASTLIGLLVGNQYFRNYSLNNYHNQLSLSIKLSF